MILFDLLRYLMEFHTKADTIMKFRHALSLERLKTQWMAKLSIENQGIFGSVRIHASGNFLVWGSK